MKRNFVERIVWTVAGFWWWYGTCVVVGVVLFDALVGLTAGPICVLCGRVHVLYRFIILLSSNVVFVLVVSWDGIIQFGSICLSYKSVLQTRSMTEPVTEKLHHYRYDCVSRD